MAKSLRKSVTKLVATSVIITLTAVGCSRGTEPKQKIAKPNTLENSKNRNAPQPELTSSNRYTGYFQNGSGENANVLSIVESENLLTKKTEIRLKGFEMKPYTRVPTTIFNTDFDAEIDRPLLEFKGNSATAINKGTRLSDGKQIEVRITIDFSKDGNSFIIKHGYEGGTITFETYSRVSAEVGLPIYLKKARQNMREIMGMFVDTKDTSKCDVASGISHAILNHDLGCARYFVLSKKHQVTEQNVRLAVSIRDYRISRLLLAYYKGPVEQFVKSIFSINGSDTFLVGDKRVSMSLEPLPILNLLTQRITNKSVIKAELDQLLEGASYFYESDLLEAELKRMAE